MKSLYISAIAVFLLFAVSSCGVYTRHHGTPKDRAGYMIDKMTDELDLTEDQVVKVNKIKDEFMANHAAHSQGHEKMHSLMIDQFSADKVDKELLKTKMMENLTNREEHLDFMIQKIDELHQILSVKQRKKLVELMSKRMNNGWHNRGNQSFGSMM